MEKIWREYCRRNPSKNLLSAAHATFPTTAAVYKKIVTFFYIINETVEGFLFCLPPRAKHLYIVSSATAYTIHREPLAFIRNNMLHYQTRDTIIYRSQNFIHHFHCNFFPRTTMFRNATPEKAIAFTHLSLVLTYCWPLPLAATMFQQIRFKIIRFLAILNIIATILPLLYAIHVHHDNIETVSKAGCITLVLAKDTVQMCFFIMQYRRFQRLIEEMRAFCVDANPCERNVLQEYVSKYSSYNGLSAMYFYLTALMMVFGVFVTGDSFPTEAEYPFSVHFEPARSIIFLQQAIAVMQIASHVCVSVFCALLMLFAAARFESLMIELRAVEDLGELLECMRKYHVAKRYACEVVDALRFVAMLMVAACAFAAVLCGISFLGKQPITVKLPFFFVAATAFLEVFICAWPADHLIDVSENVMQGAYESEWYGQSIAMQKSILLMLVPQPPVAIRISCVISVFSLNYYCSFLSNVFSLFTALRVVMVNDEDEA